MKEFKYSIVYRSLNVADSNKAYVKLAQWWFFIYPFLCGAKVEKATAYGNPGDRYCSIVVEGLSWEVADRLDSLCKLFDNTYGPALPYSPPNKALLDVLSEFFPQEQERQEA